MSAKELAYTALKVSGIYCLVLTIRMTGQVIGTLPILSIYAQDRISAMGHFFSFFIPWTLLVALTVLLLWRTEWSLQVIDLLGELENEEKIKAEGFMLAAFAVLGIIIMIDGFARAFWIPGYVKAYAGSINPSTGKPYPVFLSQPIYQILSVLLEVVLGLYLFLGGDGLVRFWRHFRGQKGDH